MNSNTVLTAQFLPDPGLLNGPADQFLSVGQTATFSVTAAGTTPLRYQWRRNTVNITNATNTTLTVSNVQRTNGGYYAVVVTNVAGSVTSSNALLMVRTPQRILPLTALGGGRYRISFSDFTGGPLFDWDLNSLEVQGSTNMSSTNWVTLTNALVISNGIGQVEFLVTNTPPPQFYWIRMR